MVCPLSTSMVAFKCGDGFFSDQSTSRWSWCGWLSNSGAVQPRHARAWLICQRKRNSHRWLSMPDVDTSPAHQPPNLEIEFTDNYAVLTVDACHWWVAKGSPIPTNPRRERERERKKVFFIWGMGERKKGKWKRKRKYFFIKDDMCPSMIVTCGIFSPFHYLVKLVSGKIDTTLQIYNFST